MVDDLRTLTLAEANELPFKKQMIDPALLIDALITRFRPLAENQGVSLVFARNEDNSKPHEKEQKQIKADSQRIEQILNNIVSNALRYTPEGGIITISERIVSPAD